MNKVFGLYETVRINTKNSYLKLNHSFPKTSLYPDKYLEKNSRKLKKPCKSEYLQT